MNLKLRQLEVFRALMASGSVSEAAQRLNCSQPTVSVALANLETEVGFPLFHRSKGFLAPTEEAEYLFQEVEQSLISIDRVKGRVREINQGGSGNLRIAVYGAPSLTLLPKAVATFAAERPDVGIDIQVRSSMQIALWAEGRQIDVGLVESPVVERDLVVREFEIPCVCVLPKDHPLTGKDRLRIADFAGQSLIAVGADNPVDTQLDDMLRAAGVEVKRSISAYFFAILRQIVRNGTGIAVVDALNGMADLGDGVTWRPIDPPITYRMAAVHAYKNAVPANATAFLCHLERALDDLLAPFGKSHR